MQDTLTPHETDPHDAFEIAPGVVLAARAENPSPNLAPGAANPSIGAPLSASSTPRNVPWTPHTVTASNVAADATTPSADTTFRVTADDHVEIPSASRWAPRIFMTLFAICGAAGAAAWPHYSDAAKQTIANWIPPLAFISQPSPETPAVAAAAPAASPAADGSSQPAAANQASAPSAATTQPAPGDAPATAAVAAPSAPASPQAARDLAAMGQQIEQLKASIEQLKAGQEKLAEQMAQQTSRDIARKPESSKFQAAKPLAPNVRPRLSALPPQPTRKPRPEFSPAQTAAILAAPRASTASALPPPQAAPTQPSPYPVQPAPYNAQAQVIDRTDGDPVGRPPMPLR